jgi:hypothetical protein
MFIVVIHGWKEATAELVQALAGALGIMVFEARPRMIGGGPAVVASFADPRKAGELAQKLKLSGIAAMVIDATAFRMREGYLIVRRFELDGHSLKVETGNGQRTAISYEEIDLLLAGTKTVGYTETKKITERKLSVGQTILSGGIPISKTVTRKVDVNTEEQEKFLYLYAGDRPPTVFSQNGVNYDGLGTDMKLSRELNFTYLISRLRQLCPGATFDDRLHNRAGQTRLLGPVQGQEANLDLAAAILARTLRPGRAGDRGY